MTGDRQALLGLALYVLVAATPTMMFWLALRLVPAASTRIAERRRRRHPPPRPSFEKVVCDLRRLRREVRGRPPTMVRRVALLSAYDDTLIDLCRIVDVDAPLASATGHERAFARLLTEAALEEAGIALDPPTTA
jgi:hypothetical protein